MGENAETIRNGIEMMNQGKVQEVMDLYADDASVEAFGSVFGGNYQGKAAVGEFFQKVFQVYPQGMKLDIENLAQEGDTVFVEWRARAALADGRPFEGKAVNVFQFRGPKVSQHRVYLDTEQVARDTGRI